MSQEAASGGNRMTTEVGAQQKLQRNPGEKHARAWEIVGNFVCIVTGVLAFLAGLLALGGLPGVWWVGVIALLVSICLFVPSRMYEHQIAGAIGLVAVTLATAVSVGFAVFSGYCAVGFMADPLYEFAPLVAVVGIGSLMAALFATSCTCVLLFKLKPKPTQAAIAIAAGVGAGALMSYLLFFLD